ncbi:MAG: DUF1127 domain-containing protein [Pseudomonadota bacterium]
MKTIYDYMLQGATYNGAATIGSAKTPETGFLSRFFKNWQAWRARRDTITQLSRLSDRELEDIGLTRDEIEARYGDR